MARLPRARYRCPYNSFRNLLRVPNTEHTQFCYMNILPKYRKQRSPRVSLEEMTPAVLRFADGHRTAAKLKVLSVTGGLLSLSQTVDQGSRVKLIFVTHAGPVLGGAEMLSPVSQALQPFRFVSLPVEDQLRLGAVIRSSLGSESQQAWIEKLRSARTQPSPGERFKGFCQRLLPK